MPLTLLATRETLYLLREDHQWRRSESGQAAEENRERRSGSVVVLETLPISCVSSVHLWPSDQCRIDIKLYNEVCIKTKSLQNRPVWYSRYSVSSFGSAVFSYVWDVNLISSVFLHAFISAASS